MEITLLGSSHGVPEPGRRYSCYMISVGHGEDRRIYFIDMGTPAIQDLTDRGIRPEKVKAVFVTHCHDDHTDGLPSFVSLISWYYTTVNTAFFLPDPTMAPAMKTWIAATGTQVREDLRFDVVQNGTFYDDGTLRVTAFPTDHCENAHSFLVEADGQYAFFTGDLSGHGPEHDFPVEALKDLPIAIAFCEAAHFPCDAYIPIFGKLDLRRVVLSHYSERQTLPYITHLREAVAPLTVTLGTDGMTFSL